MRKHGLRVTHARDVAEFTVPVRALHVTDAQQLAKEAPIDIAFVCMKSYDTAWATMLIQQYLAPDGYVVSLQNCMNEETIAGIVGWGKTLGCIASSITVNLPGARPHPPRRRQARRSAHRVSRRRSARPHHAAGGGNLPAGRLLPTAPRRPPICGASAGRNWWPTPWATGSPPAPACPAAQMLQSEPIRRFSTRLGSEAIRVGQAQGYQLEEILHLPPETIARAGEGDEAAMRACDEQRFADGKHTAAGQRPSMGQDMEKGRRTEIEFLNGFVVREGEKVGISCGANAALTDIVKRVERGELKPDPRHITELRLN